MNTRKKIQKLAMARGAERIVKEARVGLKYSAVMLEDESAGVAYTFSGPRGKGFWTLDDLIPLAGRKAEELLALFDTQNNLESSLALATANAIFNSPDQDFVEGDILSFIKVQPEDRLAMVGYFGPLVSAIKTKVRDLKIFDQIPRANDNILPPSEALGWLPRCQIALITATAIINNTLDDLLEVATSCREVAILGPSTPMVAEAFMNTPVTVLSGMVVEDGQHILQIVSEGGGTRRFWVCARKVNLRIK